MVLVKLLSCLPKSLVDETAAFRLAIFVGQPNVETLGNGSHQNVWMMILRYFK